MAALEGLGRHRRVQPEALGVAHGADLDAEALIDLGAVAERELGAAASRVEDDEGAVARREVGADGEIGEPALLLTRDDGRR